MIDRITPVNTGDAEQHVPIWMLNRVIEQINDAIHQAELLIELATPNPNTETKDTST